MDIMLLLSGNIGGRGIDLSIKIRGFGKLYEGMVFSVNSRSQELVKKAMINLIKTQQDVILALDKT
jgi:hypothetical protein